MSVKRETDLIKIEEKSNGNVVIAFKTTKPYKAVELTQKEMLAFLSTVSFFYTDLLSGRGVKPDNQS